MSTNAGGTKEAIFRAGKIASDASVCVLGAGPAGMSCALWLKSLGLFPYVLEQEQQPGGMQNFNFLQNDSLLGSPDQTGPMLAQRFSNHLSARGIVVQTGMNALSVVREPSGMLLVKGQISLAEPYLCRSQAFVIATGTRYRGLEVIEHIHGALDIDKNDVCCGPFAFEGLEDYQGLRVLIIGGGDNAIENAKLLSAAGAIVYVIARGEFRAQHSLFTAVQDNPLCMLYSHVRLLGVVSKNDAYIVEMSMLDGHTEQLVIDKVHILAGYEPNTSCLQHILAPELWRELSLDEQSYLKVDDYGRTGCRNIYAAGDVCNPRFPSVVSAIAQGAQVAKAIEMDLR